MTGASQAAPGGRCHHKRGKGRAAGFAGLFAMEGGPPWGEGRGGPGRGFGPPGHGHGPGHRGRRGRRARRGDIRAAALLLLSEEPRNGYGLMQELEERSGGVWRPSPGSVYPALAQLEDEGLVQTVQGEGRKAFELTDEGRAYVEERRERFGLPWETVAAGVPDELQELRVAGRALFDATRQIASTGSKAQLGEARRVLDDARRALYRLLAGDDPAAEE